MSESTPRFCSEITIENHPLPPKKNSNEVWKSYSSMNFTFATQENPKKKVQSEINSHHNYKLKKISNKKNQKISFSHNKIRKLPPSKFTLFLIRNLKKSVKKNDIEQKITFKFLLSKVDAFEGSDIENNSLDD